MPVYGRVVCARCAIHYPESGMPVTLRLNAELPPDVLRAAAILREGGTVAFPTETVYGLGANALSPGAVGRIFAAKARPSWDPLIVHVPTYEDVLALVQMEGDLGRRVDLLARALWPGPLTLLLPRRPHVPDEVTAGRPLVGVRVPAHPAAQALLREAKLPVAAPSANRFGHTSPTTAQHVLDDLDGRIEAVLAGGATEIGLESTVLDPGSTPMMLYRPGALSAERLEAITGVGVQVFVPVSTEAPEPAALPAPGVGLRHYAPNAKMVLVEGRPEALAAAVRSSQGERAGVMLPIAWSLPPGHHLVEPWAAWDNPGALAARLFAGLRSLESRGAEVIYCPLPGPGGLADAIRDRLLKAAREE
jgi:L-threonylcarbamoyladenylate synthase